VDEVHRFNKAQQDALLPHVENGTFTFVGATTENPYFEVIKPLVSRSRIFELQRLTPDHLKEIARRALADPESGYGGRQVRVEPDALDHLVDVAQGDARNLLNALELAVETTPPDPGGVVVVDRPAAEESIQRRALLYDKDGDAHYDTISAFIKSLRGSDPDAALYWLARMVRAGEDPRFIARRLVIFASEDVGMADPQGLSVATAAAQAVEFVGLPECQWNLAQAVIYLSTAPKSNSAMGYFDALKKLEEEGADQVPDPLKDPNRDAKGLGHGQGYKYPHAFREHWVAQQYLPDPLQGARFYQPGEQGFEAAVKERVERLRALQEGGLKEERLLERVSSGSERRRKAQIEEHGEARVRRRDRLLLAAEIGIDQTVLDLGMRPGFLGFGALEYAPLGKVVALARDLPAAGRLKEVVRAEAVDRILEIAVGDPWAPPLEGGSFERVLEIGLLQDRADRRPLLAQAFRLLAPGGRLVLWEPLLSERRGLSLELDLRPLGDDLARRIREAEEEMVRDSRDPRMTLGEETLSALLASLGFEPLKLERTLESSRMKVTAEEASRWFAPGSDGDLPGYRGRLLERISPEELARYRRLVEETLVGRVRERLRSGVLCSARKPG
jgi:putative ATPase